MKIISWNVNGIRACLKKGFLKFIEEENPDIFCIQETKAQKDQVKLDLKNYPHQFWNSAEKKGYSGVAVFSKVEPLSVQKGMGLIDEEGRVITLEFEDFYLVTVYTPNSQRNLERLEFRHKEWDKKFLQYISTLKKPVIFCGDLNVAHKEIDIARPKANQTTKTSPGNAGFTDKEREGFSKILDSGYIDAYRNFHEDKIQYTWWSYMFDARKNNIGWRIDYFGVNKRLKSKLLDSKIFDNILGSDHCPISLELK